MIGHYGIQTMTMIFVTFLTVAVGCCLADLDLRCKQDGACVCKATDGSGIDLRPLDAGEDNPFK